MATEALDLPRDHRVTIRLPHRLRVLLRALRLARRSATLCRQLAGRDDRMLSDVGVSRRKGGYGWFAEMVMMQQPTTALRVRN